MYGVTRVVIKLCFLLGIFASCFALLCAQQIPTAGNQPLPAAYIIPDIPAGFNALTASNEDLLKYGLPPKPSTDSPAYELWTKMIASGKTRLSNPTIQRTNRIHRSMIPLSGSSPQSLNPALGSSNWSGVAVLASNGYFTSYGSTVYASLSAPTLVPAPANCSTTPYTAAKWVGGLKPLGLRVDNERRPPCLSLQQ